jgi:ribosomal protein L11 methylase PrmA
MIYEKGSFRDPAGKIYYKNNRIFRRLSTLGIDRYLALNENSIISKSIKEGFLIDTKETHNEEGHNINKEELILEHEKIEYISYPYEWSFSQLKDAAIFHLDFHLFLLKNDATLIDASAYNIQFIGSKLKFIDVLSIKKYEEGEYWKGHKQFCENFLNPLILKSKKGIKFNNWFKGNLEGIQTDELNNLLNIFDKFSYNVFVHVHLLNKLENKYTSKKTLEPVTKVKNKITKKNFMAILSQLREFISKLKDYKSISTWDDYSKNNSYTSEEANRKKYFVAKFSRENNFNLIADLGCNDGEYSTLCLKNGCEKVVGFDFDINAIDKAYKKASDKDLNFLPLYFDASNPSSNIGWYQNERRGFIERANFNAIIALAFEHHLAIGKNIPLNDVVKWLVSLAPSGLIEFVPKKDETIQKMLEFKGDIFPDYTEANFEKILLKYSEIISKNIISDSKRTIYEYKRHI